MVGPRLASLPVSGPESTEWANVFDPAMDVGHKRGNRNAKWCKHGAEALPAWVAEHDFRPPPAVLDAMRRG